MSILKLKMPDPGGKRRLVASTGGIGIKTGSTSPSGYPRSSTAYSPITKYSQYAGSGASVTMTQPMFFSPLHTPQNWQIASKRRECYQWCHVPGTTVLMSDGTLKAIDNIQVNDEVVSHTGKPRKVLNIGRRYVNEDIVNIKVCGLQDALQTTSNHKLFSLSKSRIAKKEMAFSSVSSRFCSSRLREEKDNKAIRELIDWIPAGNILDGDFLFSPKIDIEDRKGVFFSNDICFFLGLFAAEGSIIWYKYKGKKYPKGIRLTLNKDETKLLNKVRSIVETNFSCKIHLYHNGPKTKPNNSWDIHIFSRKIGDLCFDNIGEYSNRKKISNNILWSNEEQVKSFLCGIISGDGTVNKRTGHVELTTASYDMSSQIPFLLMRLNIPWKRYSVKTRFDTINYSVLMDPICKQRGITKYDICNIQGREKTSVFKGITDLPFGQSRRVDGKTLTPYSGFVYNIEVEEDHSYVANFIVVKNCRFYYENEPKVAAGVDFYCFDPTTPILMSDGEQKSISSLREGDLIRSHDGTINKIVKVHSRQTSEEMLSIFISGVSQGPLGVTKNHTLYSYRDNQIVEIKAENLVVGDYLITPCEYEENNTNQNVIDPKLAWLIGVYAAEGCGMPYEHTSNHGKLERHYKGIYFTLSIDEFETFAPKIISHIESIYGPGKTTLRTIPDKNITIISAYGRNIADDFCGLCPGISRDGSKRLAPLLMKSSRSTLTQILAGFLSGDGCFNRNNGFQGVGVSKKLSEQIANICDRLGLEYSFTQTRMSKQNRQTIYNVRISRRACDILQNLTHKINDISVDEYYSRNLPYRKEGKFIVRKIRKIKKYNYIGEVFDLTIENSHSYIANRVAAHNCNFPMTGFKLECKDSKILDYFEDAVERIELSEWMNYISHEYYLLGEVFPFLEISCPVCNGRGYDPETGEQCRHEGGTIKSIRVLNPDYIEVQSNVLADEPVVALLPDEELKMIIQRKQPKQIYDRLPNWLKGLIASGNPIPLSNRSVSHIKHNASPYGTYGSSMLRRLFTILAYKTKIMTAVWIVAERLIIPIRVVKIGDKDRPANEDDIQDVINQLSAVSNDPNLTIVTHHAFEYEWYGAEGKIHQVNNDLEYIGKEILDGLMLNQAILNGEMAGYCHSEDTLALTDSGFKKYNEISEKDQIACYNSITKNLEYHPYIAKHVFDYSGEMVKFLTDKIDIFVTPNHRMWTAKRNSDQFEFIEAKNVKNRAKFIGSVDGFDGNGVKDVKISDQSIPIYEYCELAGFYVSEGYVTNEKRKGRKNQITSVAICQSSNGKARQQIESLFERSLDHHYSNKNTILSYNPKLAQHLKSEYGQYAHNKHLPSWLKNLAPEYLEIVINAMLQGDGTKHKHENRKANNYAYYSCSEQLARDFAEIAFKCGYVPKITKRIARGKDGHYNKHGFEFNNRRDMYCVYISKGFKGKNPTLQSKSKKYAGKEIVKENYNGKVWCFTVPTGLFVTMRNGKITIQGNSAAQVGVETMLRRLENWRNKLKTWVEKKIFLPIAMMQGFIDEEKTKRLKKTVYLYPKIKFNDMGIRDNSNKIQIMLQAYDKGMVSAQTILSEMGLDYDAEIEKRRQENLIASAMGQLGGAGPGGPGGPGGAPMMGGGAGGAPPMDMGGAPPTGAPGGGMPGEMGGGAPGGMPGGAGGMAPGMMPMGGGVQASAPPPRVMKKGKGEKKEQEQVFAPNKILRLTKLEATMYEQLRNLKIPYRLFGQYEIHMPNEPQPFVLDFAYPEIGVGVESDGMIWHERSDLKEKDIERDQKLSSVGWRIMRFSEEAIYEHANIVQDIVRKNIVDAVRGLKKKSEEDGLEKIAGTEEGLSTTTEYVEDEGKLIACVHSLKKPNVQSEKI